MAIAKTATTKVINDPTLIPKINDGNKNGAATIKIIINPVNKFLKKLKTLLILHEVVFFIF
jgi:hypothetical protein